MAARPRRRSRLADLFGRGADPLAATRVQLAPRRLEPRRMLDAAAPALALELADLSSEYVQASDDFMAQALTATETPAAASANSPPTNIQILPLAAIDENGIATLELVFDDADPLDTHTVEVDWGDGSVEVFNVSPGSQFFGTTHQYLDDDPSVTPSDVYNIGVKVTDSAGDFATASAPITVNNVAPSNLQIAPMAPISENGVGTLELTFDDPGSLDTHTVEVDWGDGNVEVFNVPQGSRFFGTTHQYLDDNPTGTVADNYTVNVRVLDDDGGEVAGSTSINVSNVAPSNLQLAPIADVNENGFAQFNLTFDDPGTLDTHKVEVDWGDGTVELLDVTPGARAFSATHQYLDDNPTATASDQYTVKVRLLDDDLGEIAAAPATVTVHNVAPSGIVIDPLAPIDENGVAVLNLTFTDPGSLDSHTVEIDWGDGTVETLPVAAGARALSTSHQYLDDNPTGTPSDVYTITVKVRDDDDGVAAAGTSVTVNNVAPVVLVTPATGTIAEGASLGVLLAVSDVGTQDTLTYQIDWGDGHVTSGAATAAIIPLSHIYADNGVYTVKATVTDDDGGQTTQTVQITVDNVAPQLTVVDNQTVNEGSLLSLANIGVFTDPGFDNPLNVLDPSNGGETTETFTYTINWGDGTTSDAGFAIVDVLGGVGTPTAGSFDGSHTYADNGVYTVTVTVFDDDGGHHSQTFTVQVNNVAPTLAAIADRTTNEGSLLSIANLGQLTDPGFTNPLNPVPGGETAETFTYTINWGDGTATDAGSATVDVLGSAGVLTAASFDGAHTYADDGIYTVTVTVFDDDGGQAVQTFVVTINNVAPTLQLTVDESLIDPIDEGGTTQVTITGVFSDPGFDNPNNTAPGLGGKPSETSETFTYEVNWGDGTPAEIFSLADINGSPGVDSTGSISRFFTHHYVDNDLDGVKDARYTVKVTVFDDDGGSNTQTFEVIVYNTNPVLQPISATPVNTKGITTLTLTFDDLGAPGVESFKILIDWGDQLQEVDLAERFKEQALPVDVPQEGGRFTGPTPHTFVFTHQYDGPPDPLHPTADIVISVKIQDDDFGTATSRPDSDPLTIDGQSNIEVVAITNPGLGAEPFRIDTTPQVALLTFPERVVTQVDVTTNEIRAVVNAANDEGGSAGDSRAAGEQYLELRVINPDGSFSEGYRLRPEVLNNLQALFRKLPDNHYAIYLVQSETNNRRLVIEVYVRNGKVIDPGDDSEGARDRPPTDESTTRPNPAVEKALEQVERGDGANDPTTAIEPAEPNVELPRRLGSSSAVYHRTALAGVALALSGAGRDWHRQLEQAIAAARPGQWKRLKTAGHRRRTKPK